MLKKGLSLFIFLLGVSCFTLKPTSVHSHYCSDIQNKCMAQCVKSTLKDTLQSECYEGCQKAYRQCLKDHPQYALEDWEKTAEKLQREADYCSGLHQKWREKCAEITLNDTLRDKCYGKGQKAYEQCLKEHPQCAALDRCEGLQSEVYNLRSKLSKMEGALKRQEHMQRQQEMKP